jgi:hypothetical protein
MSYDLTPEFLVLSIYVGQTAGRGRMDREHKTDGHVVKNIYVYPLVHDVRQRLCGDQVMMAMKSVNRQPVVDKR